MHRQTEAEANETEAAPFINRPTRLSGAEAKKPEHHHSYTDRQKQKQMNPEQYQSAFMHGQSELEANETRAAPFIHGQSEAEAYDKPQHRSYTDRQKRK